MKLLFHKSKNPLNMATLTEGGKIAAADFVYNGFIRDMLAPIIPLPKTTTARA